MSSYYPHERDDQTDKIRRAARKDPHPVALWVVGIIVGAPLLVLWVALMFRLVRWVL